MTSRTGCGSTCSARPRSGVGPGEGRARRWGGAATFRDVHRSPFRQHLTPPRPLRSRRSPLPCRHSPLPCFQPRGAQGGLQLPLLERSRAYPMPLPQFPHLLWCGGAKLVLEAVWGGGEVPTRVGDAPVPAPPWGPAARAPSSLLCPFLSLLEPGSGLGCRGGGSFLFAQDRRGWGGPVPSF